jgi:cell wall-associated NlpC family hydrolase
VKPTSVGRATFPARTRQLTSQALTEGKTVPAVSPRARVRLRAVAVAFTVSSSLTLGIGIIGPASAQAAPVTTSAASTAAAAAAISAAASSTTVAATAVTTKKTVKTVKKTVKKAAPKLSFGVRVVRDASVYRGTPYQYGAAGPNRFDCSGFTRFIFAKFGISLPHSSSGQYSVVRHVANKNKQVGDLVFFHTSSGHVYHVGIYAGGNQIWAATHTGDFVRLEGIWSASYYVGRVG